MLKGDIMSESSGASAPSSSAPAAAAPVAGNPVSQQAAGVVAQGSMPKAPEQQSQGQDSDEGDMAALAGEEANVKAAQKKLDNAKTAQAKKDAEKQLEKAKLKYELKVDGEESDWEGSEEDLIRELQLSKKARKEIEKSSNVQKDVAKLVKMLKENPELVLMDPAIGVDPIEFAKKIIQQQIENESKSPDQVKREQLEKELEDLRSEKKRAEEEMRNEMYNRQVAKYEAELEESVEASLSASGLPKTPYILKRMTDVMLSGIENKKDISPKQALNIVKREMDKDLKEMFAVSGEDLLEELLGSDTLKKLNKRQLEKFRASKKVQLDAARVQETGQKTQTKTKEEPRKKMSINEWMRKK
jgi:hypothetical protein